MEHSLFLRQYKYEMPGSTLWAFFDFENGGFQLEGNSRYILSANYRFKNSWLAANNDRLFIDANMKPEIPAGPDDNLKNELLLCLKGSIHNGARRHKCSGLLSLNRNWKSNKAQWMIYCSLMDNDLHFFELRLILPVFTSLVQTPGYN